MSYLLSFFFSSSDIDTDNCFDDFTIDGVVSEYDADDIAEYDQVSEYEDFAEYEDIEDLSTNYYTEYAEL